MKYPIGRYHTPARIDADTREEAIRVLEAFPQELHHAVNGLMDHQLDTPYRPDGWTIRQVVHHCADSHMNAIIRFKLALTEDKPVIKPYAEAEFARLADSAHLAPAPSLQILDGLHRRWAILLRSLQEEEWGRTLVHPQYGREFRLDDYLLNYAWHCRHHLAHITGCLSRNGWA